MNKKIKLPFTEIVAILVIAGALLTYAMIEYIEMQHKAQASVAQAIIATARTAATIKHTTLQVSGNDTGAPPTAHEVAAALSPEDIQLSPDYAITWTAQGQKKILIQVTTPSGAAYSGIWFAP